MRTLARCFWPIALVLVLIVASSAITAAAGDGAIVYNRDEAICRFTYEGGRYTGPATFVITRNGHLTVQCNATLVEGIPVVRAIRWDQVFPVTMPPDEYWVPCTIQLTPSGNANLRCNAWIDGP